MDASNLISNLGFPIFVAVWMMYQNQKLTNVISDFKIAITEQNKEFTNAISELKVVISELTAQVNNQKED